MPPRDEQDYEARRQQIIDGALQVFASEGFEKATNKDIARAAHINSPGLIYHYFKDKTDLFRQVIERCIDMTEEDLAVWSDGARRLGREVANDPDVDAAYRRLFRAASASTSGTSKPIDRRVAT